VGECEFVRACVRACAYTHEHTHTCTHTHAHTYTRTHTHTHTHSHTHSHTLARTHNTAPHNPQTHAPTSQRHTRRVHYTEGQHSSKKYQHPHAHTYSRDYYVVNTKVGSHFVITHMSILTGFGARYRYPRALGILGCGQPTFSSGRGWYSLVWGGYGQ